MEQVANWMSSREKQFKKLMAEIEGFSRQLSI
jgi:hypothetical protein